MNKLGVFLAVIVTALVFQNFTPYNQTNLAPLTCKTVPGGNYNVDPDTYRDGLIVRSGLTWFRGIIDIYKLKEEIRKKKYTTTSEMGIKIKAFKNAKANGLNTVLSLKSSFLENGLNVPKFKSTEDLDWLNTISFVMAELRDSVDIFVVGNEPLVETSDLDMQFSVQDNYNPMSRYYIGVTSLIHDFLSTSGVRASKRIYMGSFNRLDVPSKRDIDGVQRMITFAQRDPRIDGIDVHVHVPSLAAAETQLDYLRNTKQFTKSLIVTEFSLMWLFKQHLPDSLCFSNGQKSRTFCDHLRLETTGRNFLEIKGAATELDFINMTLNAPVDQKISQAVFAEFFTSRSYLPADYMGESYATFNRYGVGMASYTFDQNDPNESDTWVWKGAYTFDDTPTRIYPLVVPQSVMKLNDGIPVNPYLYYPFKRILSEAVKYNTGKACSF